MSSLPPVAPCDVYEFIRANGPVNTDAILDAFKWNAPPTMVLCRLRARGFIAKIVGAYTSTTGDVYDVCVAREHIREAARLLADLGGEHAAEAAELRAYADGIGNGRAVVRYRGGVPIYGEPKEAGQ